MAQNNIVDELVDVQFYTPLDAYYYTVDNRPLNDLDENIRIIAAATDASAGSARRAALSTATSAYAELGFGELVGGDPIRQAQGMFSSDYELSGFELRITHGYMVRPVDQGGSPAYIEPVVAVHDAITALVVQSGRGGTVQVTYRDSTTSDRVPSGDSNVQVAIVSFKQGTGPGVFPIPDANNIAIMHVDVPSGATQLEESHLSLVNMKTVAQTSNIVNSSSIAYISHTVSVSAGLQNISLTNSPIDTSKMVSVEVFVQGVNQFNWTYNSSSNQITLQSPLSESAEVRVRQAILQYI